MRGGWIYTGDRFVERDGYFYFQGRADDLVKVSGQWVWPLEIERCLNEHEDVKECAVLAHQLADQRMTLRAVVVLRQGGVGDAMKTRELQDYVRTVDAVQISAAREYVAELPKTAPERSTGRRWVQSDQQTD